VYGVLKKNVTKMQMLLMVESNFREVAQYVRFFQEAIPLEAYHPVIVLKSRNLVERAEIAVNFPKMDVYYDVDNLFWKHSGGWEVLVVRPDCYIEYAGKLSDFENAKKHVNSRVRRRSSL